ncbi:MAG TPA: 23S rRNA (adenine(2503)-C(2))-methyltransferase RlmN [Terriglobales bacterium]|nr:23S rRNA (adenine(2503)-C(2))-methyltransferase RlmN [Terriglobales bacterium]
MSDRKQIEILGLDIQGLTAILTGLGEPPYRGKQLFEAVYRQRIGNIEHISTLPKAIREQLESRFTVGLPTIQNKFMSVDGTIRYLISLSDGQTVETVWMPEGDGGEEGDGSEDEQKRDFNRATICVSSQVGCAVNCQFCLTALLGVKRSLAAGEIVGQILAVLNDRDVAIGSDRINLVFMGMGEPFLNYDNFMQAVHLLVDGVGIPESRMTVSTAGIVPRIYDFAKEPVRPKLAISLNASNDELRERVMPINRKWNLQQLLNAVRDFPLRAREKLTFEYVLLRDVNDQAENAREIVKLLRGIRGKVNLIALNPGPDIPFATPEEDRVLSFQRILVRAGIPAFIRRPRGRDIYAACGQLKRTTEVQPGGGPPVVEVETMS